MDANPAEKQEKWHKYVSHFFFHFSETFDHKTTHT